MLSWMKVDEASGRRLLPTLCMWSHSFIIINLCLLCDRLSFEPCCVFRCVRFLFPSLRWTLALFHSDAVSLDASRIIVAHKTVLSRAAFAIAVCCLSTHSIWGLCLSVVVDVLHAVRPTPSVAVCVYVFLCVCVCAFAFVSLSLCGCFFVSASHASVCKPVCIFVSLWMFVCVLFVPAPVCVLDFVCVWVCLCISALYHF